MLNSIKKTTSKYTRLLIRMDDISENMNWKYMDKCETLFDKFNLRPLLGVIPENKDPELLKYPKNSNFWKRVESWKKKGWEISMHGYSHLYERQTNKKDFFNYGGGSEFFGLNYEDQLYKIKLGLEKFREKNRSTDVLSFPSFIAKEIKKVREKKVYIGDIAVSYEIINLRGKKNNFYQEFDKAWVHGILHLVGYDHKKNTDYFKMYRIERKILNLIN